MSGEGEDRIRCVVHFLRVEAVRQAGAGGIMGGRIWADWI